MNPNKQQLLIHVAVLKDMHTAMDDIVLAMQQVYKCLLSLENHSENDTLPEVVDLFEVYCGCTERYDSGSVYLIVADTFKLLLKIMTKHPEHVSQSLYASYSSAMLNIVKNLGVASGDDHIRAACVMIESLSFIEVSLFGAQNCYDVTLSLTEILLTIEKVDELKLVPVTQPALSHVHSLLKTECEDFLTLFKTDVEVWSTKMFIVLGSCHIDLRNLSITILRYFRNNGCFSSCPENMLNVIKERCLRKMEEIINQNSSEWKDLWCLIFDVTEVCSKKRNIFNELLKVVTLAFKSSQTDVRVQAFKCWQYLLMRYKSDPTFSIEKGLRLLLKPLIADNTKGNELLCEVKFDVWWYLLQCLQNVSFETLEGVIPPFLEFCFGPWSTTSDIISWNTPLLSYSQSLNDETDIFYVKNSKTLKRKCACALYELLKYNTCKQNELSMIPSFQSCLIKHPSDFLKISKYLIFSVGECTVSLSQKNGKEDLEVNLKLLTDIWNLLMWHTHILSLQRAPEDKVIRMTKDLQRIFQSLVCLKPKYDLGSSIWMIVLESVLLGPHSLPDKVLVSHLYALDSAMYHNPALFFLHKLVCLPLVTLQGKQDRYMLLLKKLIDLGISYEKLAMTFVQSFVEKFKAVLENNSLTFEQKFTVWSYLTKCLTSYMVTGGEINQGNDIDHDFTALYSIFMIPLLYLHDGSIDQVHKLKSVWEKFTSQFCKSSKQVPNTNVNEVEENLCLKVMKLVEKNSFNAMQLLMASDIVHTLCANTQFNVKSDSDSSKMNLKPAREIKDPFHHVKYMIKLLSCLLGYLQQHGLANELHEHAAVSLAQCLNFIFRNVTDDLFMPLMDKLSSHIMEFFKLPLNVSCFALNREISQFWASVLIIVERSLEDTGKKEHLVFLTSFLKNYLSHLNKSICFLTWKFCKNKFELLPFSLQKYVEEIDVASLQKENDSLLEDDEDKSLENPVTVFMKSQFAKSPAKFTEIKGFHNSPQKTPEKTSSKRAASCDVAEIFDTKIAKKTPISRGPLTPRQREMMRKRRDNIPALYSDLSQDSQLLMTESSQDE